MLGIKEFKKNTGVHVTEEMTGKLTGMYSLSTCCRCNKYCLARQGNPEMICHECFAEAMNNMYKDNFVNCFTRNTEILTSKVIPVKEWPLLNVAYFRFEAFADLNNDIQFINYLNFTKRNPGTTFTIWTKNPWIIDRVFKAGYKKPKNMIIGVSGPFYNTIVDVSQYWFVDFVFTVYTAKFALDNNININCGDRHCLECLRCYKHHKGIIYVNEIVKREQKRYYKQLAKRGGKNGK